MRPLGWIITVTFSTPTDRLHHLLPQQARYIEKSMDDDGRKETAATPPKFTGNKAKEDCAGDDNGATSQVDNAEQSSCE